MDKAANMGKTSATGSVKLFFGRIASTLVLAIGTIIVGIYISESQYGLYTIALVPAATFLLFQDLGVGAALTKYCASYRALKKESELRSIITSGLVFEILTGITLTFVSLMAANFVASIFGEPESAFLIVLSSITILSAGIFAFCTSVIVGFERMGLSTIGLIVSAIAQGLLSPLLVYFGFGAFGAIIGFTTASISSAITGLLLVYFSIYRKLPVETVNKKSMYQALKPLLRFGVPLSIATIISGATAQIINFLMATYTGLAMIGNYNIALNFAVFISFITYPLQTVLFPTFSKIDSLKDKQLLKTIYKSSVKYSSLFLVPATMAIMVLSVPMISTLYGGKWLFAPFFLTLYVAGNLVVLLGNLSYNRLLYAMGETKMLMKLSALTLCISIPLGFLLIPTFGILGVIIVGALISPTFGLIIGIYWTWKHYEAKPDFQNSAKILLASSIATLATFLLINTFAAAPLMTLALGAIVFLFVYLISIPLVGALNLTDTNNLRYMFSGIKLISKVLAIPLIIIEKLVRAKEKHLRLPKKQTNKNNS